MTRPYSERNESLPVRPRVVRHNRTSQPQKPRSEAARCVGSKVLVGSREFEVHPWSSFAVFFSF